MELLGKMNLPDTITLRELEEISIDWNTPIVFSAGWPHFVMGEKI